jgi:hypothetical protein
LYQSGCDEDYNKKEKLLQEISELAQTPKKEKEKGEGEKRKLIRKTALENLNAGM